MSSVYSHPVNASANLNSNSESESNHVEDERTFSNGIGMYADAAKQRINDVAQRVTSTVSDVYNSVSQRVQTGTEAVQPTINDTVSTVKSTAGDISERANNTMSNLTSQASSTASSTAASVKSMVGRGGSDSAELKQENNKMPKQNEISYGSAYANSKSITNNIDQERTESRTTADVHDSKPNIKLNNTNATMSPTRTKQHYSRDSDNEQRAGGNNPAADIKTGDREGEQTNHGTSKTPIAGTKQSPSISTNHTKNQQEMSAHKQTEEGPPKSKQNLPNSMVLKSAL